MPFFAITDRAIAVRKPEPQTQTHQCAGCDDPYFDVSAVQIGEHEIPLCRTCLVRLVTVLHQHFDGPKED